MPFHSMNFQVSSTFKLKNKYMKLGTIFQYISGGEFSSLKDKIQVKHKLYFWKIDLGIKTFSQCFIK